MRDCRFSLEETIIAWFKGKYQFTEPTENFECFVKIVSEYMKKLYEKEQEIER